MAILVAGPGPDGRLAPGHAAGQPAIMPLDRCGGRGGLAPVDGIPGRTECGQFVEHVGVAIPARLETVVEKLGVTVEHVVNPGPEQAQARCALLPYGQVRPPDGPAATPALRADEAARPPQPVQEVQTVSIGREPGLELPGFPGRSRVVHTRPGPKIAHHPSISPVR
jgi:hypothetical protein